MEWIKKALSDVNSVLKALGSTLRELADSKKAVVTAVASTLTLIVTAYPQFAQYQDVVYTKVDVFLGILVIMFGLIDAMNAAHPQNPGG